MFCSQLPAHAADDPAGEGQDVLPATILPAEGSAAPPVRDEIERRPGRFVADPRQAERPVEPVAAAGEGFSATYADADVPLVVNQLLGGYLGLDYSIAPDVTGRVTLRVSDVRTRAQALDILRAALEPLNIIVVERGDFVGVVRGGGGGGAVGEVVVLEPGAPAPAHAGAAVITPRYIAPSAASGLIAPFTTPSSVAITDDQRRIMIVRGTAEEITAASEAIALFDVDWFAQVSTGVFQLEHVSPEEIAGELAPLLGPASSSVELVPVARLGSLVVLARSPEGLDAARAWIERLDAPPAPTTNDGLLIYDARYTDAEALADSVRRLMGGGGGALSGAPLGPAAPRAATGSDPGANTGRITPQPQPNAGAPSYGDANGVGASGFGPMIAAEPDQNAVIARGTREEIAEVRELLIALDRPRAQVLIEATIVEVTLNDELRYGVNWAGVEDERIRTTFSDAPNGAVTSRFPGFSVSYVNTDIEAALNLLSSMTEVEVVSRPSVIALHNATAALQIGDQVPIVTQSAVSVLDPDAPIVNQTTYRDTGVILTVTPHIRAGGVVEIEVVQEVSDVARTTTSGIDSPTITQRRIESTLLVPSGEAVALGGLISTSRAVGETGVPVLRRAPVVGQLFRTNSDVTERTELIVFLTPQVLADPRQAVEATTQMRAAMARLEALIAEQ